MQKEKNGREKFKKPNIEAVSERSFEKLLKLVWDIWFMLKIFVKFCFLCGHLFKEL